MGIGPIIIFDKSTLESLSVDESVWLDTHYKPNITPLFFVETLADLKKEVACGRSPQQVVGNIAEKTPMGGRPNVHHQKLCVAELMGEKVHMSRRPIIDATSVTTSDGKRGTYSKQPPEHDAFQRWSNGEFLAIEEEIASNWRQQLTQLDLKTLYEKSKQIIKIHGRPKNLTEAKELAESLLAKYGSRYAFELMKRLLPQRGQEIFLRAWNKSGRVPISSFAPYTAYVLTINLFFCIALGASLISWERPTNFVDIAYLYYLPFCMIFTSNDKLHIRTAPLFLGEGQIFIEGKDFKNEMAKLDEHYSQLPQEIKVKGVLRFANFPPLEGDFLTSRLWDQLMNPNWRESAKSSANSINEKLEIPKEIKQRLEEVKSMGATPKPQKSPDQDNDVLIAEYTVSRKKGKWQILPPEA